MQNEKQADDRIFRCTNHLIIVNANKISAADDIMSSVILVVDFFI